MIRAARTARAPLEFSCDCGQLRGHLDPVHGNRAQCFCADCRAAELFFGRPDPAPGPVDLFQTMPDWLTLTHGADRLALLRLGPRGLLRWYAGCCDTPMFNTLAKPTLPFVAVHLGRLADPARAGRVGTRSFVPQPGGSRRHEGGLRLLGGVFVPMLVARLSGRWRRTPFFDASGAPVAEARIPDRKTRAALYPDGRG